MAPTPVITASTVTCKKGNQAAVTLKVKDFTGISAMSLRLEYKGQLIAFKRATFATKLKAASTPQIGTTILNDIDTMFEMSWSCVKGVTLKKGQILATLYFKCAKVAGETPLHWNNTVNNSGECIFAIIDGIPVALPDDDSNFIDGAVIVK